MENTIFSDNCGLFGGGAIACMNASPEVYNSLFLKNSSQRGAAIYCQNVSDIKLINVSITNNTAINQGETIGVGGSIYCIYNSNPLIYNSILWNNHPHEIYFDGQEWSEDNSITINYSLIKGGVASIKTNNFGEVFWGDGNLELDPLFLDTVNYNYRLSENSPCIDAGTQDTTGLNIPNTDLDGNERIWNGRIDIGAYEYGSGPPSDIIGQKDFIPKTFSLSQNYPNPFNPITTIKFGLPKSSKVKLEIYNILGQKVKTLLNNQVKAGYHTLTFSGVQLASGMYFYRIEASEFNKVKKMLLLK